MFIFNFELLYSSNWRGGCLAVEELQGGDSSLQSFSHAYAWRDGGPSHAPTTLRCQQLFQSLQLEKSLFRTYCTEYSYLSTLTKHAFPLSSSRIRTIIPNTYTDQLSISISLLSTVFNALGLYIIASSSFFIASFMIPNSREGDNSYIHIIICSQRDRQYTYLPTFQHVNPQQ